MSFFVLCIVFASLDCFVSSLMEIVGSSLGGRQPHKDAIPTNAEALQVRRILDANVFQPGLAPIGAVHHGPRPSRPPVRETHLLPLLARAETLRLPFFL